MELIIILLIAVEVVIVRTHSMNSGHPIDHIQVLVRDVPEFFEEKKEDQHKRETLA